MMDLLYCRLLSFAVELDSLVFSKLVKLKSSKKSQNKIKIYFLNSVDMCVFHKLFLFYDSMS